MTRQRVRIITVGIILVCVVYFLISQAEIFGKPLDSIAGWVIGRYMRQHAPDYNKYLAAIEEGDIYEAEKYAHDNRFDITDNEYEAIVDNAIKCRLNRYDYPYYPLPSLIRATLAVKRLGREFSREEKERLARLFINEGMHPRANKDPYPRFVRECRDFGDIGYRGVLKFNDGELRLLYQIAYVRGNFRSAIVSIMELKEPTPEELEKIPALYLQAGLYWRLMEDAESLKIYLSQEHYQGIIDNAFKVMKKGKDKSLIIREASRKGKIPLTKDQQQLVCERWEDCCGYCE